MAQYTIDARNLGPLQAKLADLDKKARKLGLAPITLQVTGYEDRVVLERAREFDPTGELGITDRVTRRFAHIDVVGESPTYDGWQLVCTLQAAGGEAGTLIRAVPGMVVPTSYRTADQQHCDHCGMRRNRIDTYVVHNQESGQYKQVGSTCIRDFLGNDNAQSLAKMAEYYADVMLAVSESDGEYRGSGGMPEYYDTRDYLAAVVASIRTVGWRSRGMVRQDADAGKLGGMATADVAACTYESHPLHPVGRRGEMDCYCGHQDIGVTDADVTESETAIGYVRNALADRANGANGLNDYEYNLSVVIRTETLERRTLGIAASAIGWYRRETVKVAERAERARQDSTSAWFGAVGKRASYQLRVVSMFARNTDWGLSTIVRMADAAGNVAIWYASGSVDLVQGATYQVTGTVKKHDTYRDCQQTILTRCKLPARPGTTCPDCGTVNPPSEYAVPCKGAQCGRYVEPAPIPTIG